MASVSDDNGADTCNEGWLAFVNEKINKPSCDPAWSDFFTILKKLLLSDCTTMEIADIAHRIDIYYYNTYVNLYPLLKFNTNKMECYLKVVYSSIFDLARVLHYKNPKHDALVQLIFELHKIPPKTFKIWGEDFLVYSHEPIFGELMDIRWCGGTVYDENEQAAENGCAESKKKCAEWVNFSSFLARCIAAGVYPEGLDRFRYPISDIVEGLEKDVSGATGIKRTYRVMAAAQYILLAPKVIYEELGEIKEWELGMGKWNLWAHRFKEIANKYDFGSETNAVVKEARDKMISFDPSQFFVSEGGNKPDP